MPSDGAPAARAAWLRSQLLGLWCGFLTVVLLGVGSVVIASTRETASAAIQMDDLRGFFDPPRLEHAWLYLLIPVLLLYALNTALCTWDSLVARVRRRARELSAYAPILIHLSFLGSLLAHAVGGFTAREGPPVALGREWVELGDGAHARTVGVTSEVLADGRLKSVDIRLELREADGRIRAERLGFNEPVSSGLGSRLLLLARVAEGPSVARLSLGAERCVLQEREACTLGGRRVLLQRVFTEGHWGKQPVAAVRVEQGAQAAEDLYVLLGQPSRLRDGAALGLDSLEPSPVVIARVRSNPGTPLALGAVVLLALGLAAMGRRWLWPDPASRAGTAPQ